MGYLSLLLLAAAILALLAFFCLFVFFKLRFRYWEERKFPHSTPSFPCGDMFSLNSKNIGQVIRDIYNQFPGMNFVGIWVFHRPALLVRDPELIKTMMIKDFMQFHDRGTYYNEEKDPLSASLVSLKGVHWRNVRAKLTPSFTTGKIKAMLPIVLECAKDLLEVLQAPARDGIPVDFKDVGARFGTDVISSIAFGIQTNSLKNPTAIFREMGRKVFAPTWSVNLKNSIIFLLPDLAEYIKLVVTPKDVSEFFLRVFKEAVDYRQKTGTRRNDFLQHLIELKNKGYIEDVDKDKDDLNQESDLIKFTHEQAAAQAFIFFVGGFETTSATAQFALYEMALNPEIQSAAREEVVRVLGQHGGNIDYEAIQEMTYLKRVIDETLRKYPPGAFLGRICSKNYPIPGTSLTVDKGTSVLFPIYGLHMDPQYFPQPEKFDPDRFTEEAKQGRHHYSYLPFGDGPRLCIGERFAWLQLKVALISLLSEFTVSVCEETPIPLIMNPKAFMFDALNGMKLKITKIQK